MHLPGDRSWQLSRICLSQVISENITTSSGRPPIESPTIFPIKTCLFPSPEEQSSQTNRELKHLGVRIPGLSPPRCKMGGIDTVETSSQAPKQRMNRKKQLKHFISMRSLQGKTWNSSKLGSRYSLGMWIFPTNAGSANWWWRRGHPLANAASPLVFTHGALTPSLPPPGPEHSVSVCEDFTYQATSVPPRGKNSCNSAGGQLQVPTVWDPEPLVPCLPRWLTYPKGEHCVYPHKIQKCPVHSFLRIDSTTYPTLAFLRGYIQRFQNDLSSK